MREYLEFYNAPSRMFVPEKRTLETEQTAKHTIDRLTVGSPNSDGTFNRTVPFGGYRHSGNGRERGQQGFLEIKAVLSE